MALALTLTLETYDPQGPWKEHVPFRDPFRGCCRYVSSVSVSVKYQSTTR